MRKFMFGLFLVLLALNAANVVSQSLTDPKEDLLDGSSYVGTIRLCLLNNRFGEVYNGPMNSFHNTDSAVELPNLSMEFDHATVYYDQGNEERAKDIGEAFEYAYSHLQQDFLKAPPKLKIYVYRTQDDLVQGLILYSGLSINEANFFKSGGAPRPLNYTMHVSPQFNWHSVAHELTHTFIEQYSGRAYLNIKWLDEGLAEYEAWKFISTNPMHSQEEESFKRSALNAVDQLESKDALYPLNELTTNEQWGKEMSAGNSYYIYSEAYLVVSYLVSSYGIDQVKLILKEVQNGAEASVAVERVLGKTQTKILDEFRDAFESEMFKTYATTTTVITTHPTTNQILIEEVVIIIAIGVIAIWYRKKRSPHGLCFSS